MIKQKVLFVINNLEGGGAEKTLVTILKNIDKSRFNITLYLIFYNGIYLSEIPEGIKIKYLFKSKKSGLSIRIIKRIIRYLRPEVLYRLLIKEEFDTEIAFLEGISTKIIAGSASSSKKIAWIHSNLKQHNWVKNIYKNKTDMETQYKRFDEIAFVSEDSKEAFKEIFDISNKMSVIKNPIDSVEVISKSLELVEKNNVFTICTVGRLSYEKGYDRLILAHAELIKDGFYHKIQIIGEGTLRNQLEELVATLGVENSVEFKGFQSNPYKYMKNSDVFINSSRTEGYALVIGEAMLLGLPVICTDCGGPRDIIEDGKYGLLVENSQEGLYLGMKRLISDESHISSLQYASNLRKDFFDIKKSIIDIENFIRRDSPQ